MSQITEEAVERLIEHIKVEYEPDSTLDGTSTNPPQNKAVVNGLSRKLQSGGVVAQGETRGCSGDAIYQAIQNASTAGIGYPQIGQGSQVLAQSGVDKNLYNVSITSKGVYLAQCWAVFAGNANGDRHLALSPNSTPSNAPNYSRVYQRACNDATLLQFTTILNVTTPSTHFLFGWQNSGSNINVTGGINLLKLK